MVLIRGMGQNTRIQEGLVSYKKNAAFLTWSIWLHWGLWGSKALGGLSIP